MSRAYEISRLVTMEECPWLERDLEKHDLVFQYDGATYGSIGPGGVACSYDGFTPFFEVPRDALTAFAPTPHKDALT